MIVKHLWKYYGDTLILQDIAATIGATDRIGLVGPNGVGKTTFLQVLAGIQSYEKGAISKGKEYLIGSIAQELVGKGSTLRQYLEQPFALVQHLTRQMEELQKRMVLAKEERELQELMKLYGTIQEEFERLEGYAYEVQIKAALLGLGLKEEDLDRDLATFSGGEQVRASLCYLLLRKPDLLLLDEPTNHLDIQGIEWLEAHLAAYPKAVLVVSHDRYFLDGIATHIWELNNTRLHCYKGNYTKFLGERQLRAEYLQTQAEKNAAELAKMEAYVRKNKAGNNSRQAKSVEKRMEKIERVETMKDPKRLGFSLDTERTTGKRVLTLREIRKSFGDKKILQGVSGTIRRQDRIALLGPNGCGKTTLLEIIVGEKKANGQVEYGVGVDVAYFSQNLSFQTNSTVLDEVYETYPADLFTLRSVLGRFLFSGEDVFKPLAVLSGGEKNRLALAKLFLTKANFLVLDEPTNHLDIYAREGLERALLDFSGTLLFVSHDRFFINRLATKLWIIESGQLKEFLGTFSAYKEQEVKKRQEQVKKIKPYKERPEKKTGISRKKLEKEQQELEQRIEDLEARKNALEEVLQDPSLYQDGEKSKEMVKQYQEINEEVQAIYKLWEGLTLQLEGEQDGE